MSFRTFTIDPKEPDEQHCNARIWRNEQELYCQSPPVEPGKRCDNHIPPTPPRTEDQIAALNMENIDQRAARLSEDRRNVTELDDEIIRLAAIIDEMEDSYMAITNPLVKKDFADLITKMKKTKAEIIEKRVNIEVKLRLVLDADLLWGRISQIFEQAIVDENSRKLAKLEIAKLLDELLDQGKAKSE